MPLAAKHLVRPTVQSFQKEWTCQLKTPYCVEPWRYLKWFATTVMTGSTHCQSSWYLRVCVPYWQPPVNWWACSTPLCSSPHWQSGGLRSLSHQSWGWAEEFGGMRSYHWKEPAEKRTADRGEFKAEQHSWEAFLRQLLVLSSIGKCAK